MTDDRQTDHATEKLVAIGEIACAIERFCLILIVMVGTEEMKNTAENVSEVLSDDFLLFNRTVILER